MLIIKQGTKASPHSKRGEFEHFLKGAIVEEPVEWECFCCNHLRQNPAAIQQHPEGGRKEARARQKRT